MSSVSVKLSPEKKPNSNIAYLEHDNLERFGTYTRLCFEGQSFTNFDELMYAGRIASVLIHHHVTPGDRVLTVMPNTPDLTATFQAVWTAGAVVVPVNPLWSVAELAYAIRHSGAAAVITIPQLAQKIRTATGDCHPAPRLMSFGETEFPEFKNLRDEVVTEPSLLTPVARDATDFAMLLYTSGTTARPKAVPVTHANIPEDMEAVHRVNPALPRLPMLHVLPMHHMFGTLMVQLSNRWGFPSVLMRQFDPVSMFKAIQEYQVGYVVMVPTMLTHLLGHPERPKYDFSSLYRIITGGEILPEPLRQKFQLAFRCRVDQGYGMSETGFISCYGDSETYRPGSAGWPCPGFEVRVVDEHGRSIPPQTMGEIWVRGMSVAPGYWNDEASTKEFFHDGWFRTGDMGYTDTDGYLYIADRKRDLIKKGGEYISPGEIESVLHLHPTIGEAAVIGVPDERFGEEIVAVVQLRHGAHANEREIREHVARYIDTFKVPGYVVFQSELPRTGTGKINKQELRRMVADLMKPLHAA